MVTSNKQPDKKIVKMAEQNNVAVVPQRTLLGEVNEHITCPLCRGYYIDATTIVECLHSFCRSCIIKHLQVKSYCPVCEMMINSAKPNIKLDKALQDIVYKLVPGLFQREMERRQQFYASRPGPAATATPEQRGEDTERIIFSPEDVISFSLEYADVTDADSISSKSSDSNESQTQPSGSRRYLQCPAVVNISHLKKFLSMKFDIDSTQFAIDILYKKVPLPDYYTLLDIAYIYNWKRNEPMRFFYQIIDYIAIRNRLFDINRKGSHFPDRKSSPACTEDANVNSPAPNLNDHCSEASSGTDSPMPEENRVNKLSESLKKSEQLNPLNKDCSGSQDNSSNNLSSNISAQSKKCDDEVEKSQFLISFELTAKNNSAKCSPSKSNNDDNKTSGFDNTTKSESNLSKSDDTLKRKQNPGISLPEMKKLKIELEKTKLPYAPIAPTNNNPIKPLEKVNELPEKSKMKDNTSTNSNAQPSSVDIPPPQSLSTNIPPSQSLSTNLPPPQSLTTNIPPPQSLSTNIPPPQSLTANIPPPQSLTTNMPPPQSLSTNIMPPPMKDVKQQSPAAKQQSVESPVPKKATSGTNNIASPKRKSNETPVQSASVAPRTVSPLKLQIPKQDVLTSNPKHAEASKPVAKKMPDLRPSIPTTQSSHNKGQGVGKLRMDLLANNCDPTIDRSKILSQVKSSLSAPIPGQSSGDPLKSLFDSCKINIPPSLSITLTDQKSEPRSPCDPATVDQKKAMVNKNLSSASSVTAHKAPSPPVHNFIEILKLPDADPKKPKTENDLKFNAPNKPETNASQSKSANKPSETSAKGPVPNLKPIADTKLGKQSGTFSSPITFQQTFEQQLQSMHPDKKGKLVKNKAQVPKLVPATPKSFTAASKLNITNPKTPVPNIPLTEHKLSAALDLSTPHTLQSQLGAQQTKAFETMQSIANLAKKQNIPNKLLPLAMSQPNVYPNLAARPLSTGASPLRVPSASGMVLPKLDKGNGSQMHTMRQDGPSKPILKPPINPNPPVPTPSYPIVSHNSPMPAPMPTPMPSQPSRPQTRSPSSSPKLVIAEDKQAINALPDHNINQSNQITSTQVTNMNAPKSDSPKASPGPSKAGPKLLKPMIPVNKMPGIRPPMPPTMAPTPMASPADYLTQQHILSAQHAMLRHQMDLHGIHFQNPWLKAQQQYNLLKNMTNMSHPTQNDFNKEKQ